MNDYSNIKIIFMDKKTPRINSKRKPKTITYEELMIINFSEIKPYSESIVKIDDINTIILEANLNIWRQLYSKKILRFIEDRKYAANFCRKILHDNYKTLNLLYENMGNDLIKSGMISYYEPTKKRFFKGKFLNSIIENNQTLFW
ncbi:MAG: hypothetical protein ACJ0J5_03980 [Dehalococcoidia bacterium]|nr:hypothetical protein [Chloroflexota bacterium]OUW95662.1 MAG: hypothetical protein CBD90_02565 [Chloroflexi bacterium TMED230]RZP14204.1 MAG: hypothetical protein EVA32_01125 [Chloroflexota bacterium]|tara:strand:+ start:12238 stop:12672 length:435 start_codon:yes stop_codon:yes gene_type:complete